MTNEEAIKMLKQGMNSMAGEFVECWFKKEHLQLAIDAMEKQIPRKLYVEEDADTNTYYCKSCDVEIYQKGCMHIRRAVLIPGKPKYCYNCGQRLDWGYENECIEQSDHHA